METGNNEMPLEYRQYLVFFGQSQLKESADGNLARVYPEAYSLAAFHSTNNMPPSSLKDFSSAVAKLRMVE